jgi:hypothetical protein
MHSVISHNQYYQEYGQSNMLSTCQFQAPKGICQCKSCGLSDREINSCLWISPFSTSMFFSLMQLSHVENVMLVEASYGGLILVEGTTVRWEHLGGIFYSLLKCVLHRTQEKRYFSNSRHHGVIYCCESSSSCD